MCNIVYKFIFIFNNIWNLTPLPAKKSNIGGKNETLSKKESNNCFCNVHSETNFTVGREIDTRTNFTQAEYIFLCNMFQELIFHLKGSDRTNFL